MKKDFDKELYKKIGDEAYRITQNGETEPPFSNKYYNFEGEGIYVDIVSGEPLFASLHKYHSGSGWPSFYKSLEEGNLTEHKDLSHNMSRVEIKAKKSGSHLGHVFEDGPKPSGRRYCINSAALKFISVQDLKKEGYGDYLYLFEK